MKPLLAYTVEDVTKLSYPVLASPKLDGIRCLIIDGVPHSRNMKPIPNRFIQTVMQSWNMPLLDGELIVGPPTGNDVFNRTTSGVMSRDGAPEFTFWVFDCLPDDIRGFKIRLAAADRWISNNTKKHGGRVQLVQHINVADSEVLDLWEAGVLTQGYEGVMVRSPTGAYKHGRSTARDGILGKVKRFADSEAVICGFVEQMENTNEKTQDELGRAKRSSHQAGKVGKATLGTLEVRDIHSGVSFEIGTGFDDKLRLEIWTNRKKWMGKIVKYKFQPTGVKEKPRFPVYLGLREDI